jgi:hypothetical protein
VAAAVVSPVAAAVVFPVAAAVVALVAASLPLEEVSLQLGCSLRRHLKRMPLRTPDP